MKRKNNNHKQELINALTEAQKIAFAPLTFQAVGTMLELGMLKEIDTNPISANALIEKLNHSEYAIKTLLEVGESVGVVKNKDDIFEITPLGKAFLYDEMTRVNFNFVKDVCFLGASELSKSFNDKTPYGLKGLFKEGKTIYPYLSQLPDKVRKSWYEFDHYYSDNCFDIIYEIIKNSPKIFDIGGNMGALEKVCLKNNPNCDITMIDLAPNIDFIKDDIELKNCKFHKSDVLDKINTLPKMSGCVVMSQFLDCFSKEQIKLILSRVKDFSEDNIKIYILEPFIDNQKYDGAKYSLVHNSLYFTCMANGCSKMYSKSDMEKLIFETGLRVGKTYEQVGIHDYTLLECVKSV